jgi:hypothetical protein
MFPSPFVGEGPGLGESLHNAIAWSAALAGEAVSKRKR